MMEDIAHQGTIRDVSFLTAASLMFDAVFLEGGVHGYLPGMPMPCTSFLILTTNASLWRARLRESIYLENPFPISTYLRPRIRYKCCGGRVYGGNPTAPVLGKWGTSDCSCKMNWIIRGKLPVGFPQLVLKIICSALAMGINAKES